jgi:hypothetical protein
MNDHIQKMLDEAHNKDDPDTHDFHEVTGKDIAALDNNLRDAYQHLETLEKVATHSVAAEVRPGSVQEAILQAIGLVKPGDVRRIILCVTCFRDAANHARMFGEALDAIAERMEKAEKYKP